MWRVLLLSQTQRIHIEHQQLSIWQKAEPSPFTLPLEDIGVVVLDNMHTTLNSSVLSAFAHHHIVLLVVDAQHLPSACLYPFMPHHRQLSVLAKQLAVSQPHKKQLWQQLIQQKIRNQAATIAMQYQTHQKNELAQQHQKHLQNMADRVKSGDTGNLEAQASQYYFKHLFGKGFYRQQDNFYNSALNYTYAITRALFAKYLAAYGFMPSMGLFHHNQLNAFNLADDLIEPYRALIDRYILHQYPIELDAPMDTIQDCTLSSQDKQNFIALCTCHVQFKGYVSLWSSAIENTVQSLSRCLDDKNQILDLPQGVIYAQKKLE